jgi:hypothetical protein
MLIILQSIPPVILQSITRGMTRIIHGAGVTHGAGDGLSEFPSDLADAGTAGSAAALPVQASDASALVTLAPCIRGSDASALRMRVLVAVSAAAVADSIIKPADFRSDRQVKKSRAAFRKIGRLGIAHRQNGQPGDGIMPAVDGHTFKGVIGRLERAPKAWL